MEGWKDVEVRRCTNKRMVSLLPVAGIALTEIMPIFLCEGVMDGVAYECKRDCQHDPAINLCFMAVTHLSL